MPALLISTSIDLKRDTAVSTIFAAVAGSPMWPSTRATLSEAATSVDWVIFRELATTLQPRSTNPFTIPAPIPCDAPVTMAVFRGLLMVGYPENGLSLMVGCTWAHGDGFPTCHLATSRLGRIRGAAFGMLQPIIRPPPPALGHSGNRKQSVGLIAITGVDAKHISNGEIMIGSLDYPDLISGPHITLNHDS